MSDNSDYIAPQGNRITFDLKISSYVPPQGNQVAFNLTQNGEQPPEPSDTKYVYPESYDASSFGADAFIRLGYRRITVEGFNSSAFSAPAVRNDTQYLKPSGFDASAFTRPNIINKNATISVSGMDLSRVATPTIYNFFKTIQLSGFDASAFSKPTIYNLLQYLKPSGFSDMQFGLPYMQGGVREVKPSGINSLSFGSVSVINTRADQTIKPSGIVVPSFPRPNISPQIITARGILGTAFGTAYVQRNPMPVGFDASVFGTAWVSRSPRYYSVGIGELTEFGSHKIFDAKQVVTITGVIPGGIFGDIQIRNVNLKIEPISIEAPTLSNWAIVENISRYYGVSGFDASAFGGAQIENATPSINPIGFDSADFGEHLIADRIRRINTHGIHQADIGKPSVSKTPQLSPRSIEPFDLGRPVVSLYTRYVIHAGKDMMVFGQTTIGFAKRDLIGRGFDLMRLGEPTLSHGNRELLVKGNVHSAFGNDHRVWFRVRTIAPESIFEDQKSSGHRVGGSQYVNPIGFDASMFGTRIVPEHQDVLSNGFRSSEFGLAELQKSLEYLTVHGFATGGPQQADRWGNATLYNSRQYIIQTYDVDSDLNPPRMGWWTAIENRNKTTNITGFNAAVFGRAIVANNARLIQPSGIEAKPLGDLFIAYRIRSLFVEGMESPYFSGWGNVHNAAAVIQPKGFDSLAFAVPGIANTRRTYQKVGNFESLVFGHPMISDAIRTIELDYRFSIAVYPIPAPKIELLKRYIELDGFGRDFAAFGGHDLSIHRNIITPRWYQSDFFGMPDLRNVTPEVQIFGHNSEVFGQAAIRTEWRNIDAFGEVATLFGKPSIADRTRKLTVAGFIGGAIGLHRVRGTASPPLSTQYIHLNNVDNIEDIDDTSLIKDGYGIEIPLDQVSRPSLKSNVLRPIGFDSLKFGDAHLQSNGILMENGIKLDKECGTPIVQLAIRTISVEGISSPITLGKPRLSPHTIYAVTEAPQQARDNHNALGLHAVNSDGGTRKAGEVFGKARIWQHNPYLNPSSVLPRLAFGTAHIMLAKRYVEVKGFQAYRFGWHSIGDGEQQVTHRQLNDFAVFGHPSLSRPEEINKTVKGAGLNALSVGTALVEFFHREIKPSGFNALSMGASRGQSNPYMPQSLHVGFPMPVKPVGNVMDVFGTTYIGLRVREIKLEGFIATAMRYDIGKFAERMRVKRGDGGPSIPAQTIQPVGFDASIFTASNVKYAVHYIRPDGNADQFRKGAF